MVVKKIKELSKRDSAAGKTFNFGEDKEYCSTSARKLKDRIGKPDVEQTF